METKPDGVTTTALKLHPLADRLVDRPESARR